MGNALPEWITKHINQADDGCWLWTGSRYPNGYGRCYDRTIKRVRGAHRMVYELAVAPIPNGHVIDHSCGVILCVNPDHLTPTTHGENIKRANRTRPTVRQQAHELGHIVTRAGPRKEPKDRTQVNIRLPLDLIAALDERRYALNISRDEWMKRVITWALQQPEPPHQEA